jgi:hypothetical protein
MGSGGRERSSGGTGQDNAKGKNANGNFHEKTSKVGGWNK